MKSLMRWILALTVALALHSIAAKAQQPVWTIPEPATSAGGNASSTIAVTNTFQKVFSSTSVGPAPVAGAGTSPRHGCTIINQGANTMWVTEGYTIASALKANAVVLAVNQPYYCHWNGVVLTGEIDITGTAGDGFYAAQY